MTRNREFRTLTERIEAMWLEVDFHVEEMEQAEKEGYRAEAADHLERIIRYLTRIQEETLAARA